jgi:predicted nucleotidyltransferase
MPSSADILAEKAARAFAATLARRWQTLLGDQLLGAYLLGSLAHGGFSRRYSDIDVGAVTATGLAPAVLDAMRAEAAGVSAELASKMSIFWTDRNFSQGRFPPLDRADFLDCAVSLFERERVNPPRPALGEVRSYLSGLPFSNWVAAAERFCKADALDPKDRKPYLRAHLYPARFAYSFVTGRMASNDDAVAWLRGHSPPGLDLVLIERALKIRQAADDPDALFPERQKLRRQIAACRALAMECATERP